MFSRYCKRLDEMRAAFAPPSNARAFVTREDGTVTAFAAMIFVLMVGAGGIAIDVMRYETQRVQLQSTLDRAVLAAASMAQQRDPEEVVRGYFAATGIQGYRLDVRVEDTVGSRRVDAYAELEIGSMFMHLFGVRTMTSPALSAAEDRRRNIEIAMTLDVSGSMGGRSRMTNMTSAATAFVTQVIDQLEEANEDAQALFSLVPFSDRVYPGPALGSAFTFDNFQTFSNCSRFSSADYFTTSLDPTVPIQRLGHWDQRSVNISGAMARRYHCDPNESDQVILPWEHREDILHAHINDLGRPNGSTAIDVGLNWAVALLDPAAAPALTALIASGDVHADFANRPAPYIDGDLHTTFDDDTVKVLILMTDGENWDKNDINTYYDAEGRYIGYRGGYAPIFLNGDVTSPENNGRYSVWHEAAGQFWIPTGDPDEDDGDWEDAPLGGFEHYGISEEGWENARANTFNPAGSNGGQLLSWTHLFNTYSHAYIFNNWFEVPADEAQISFGGQPDYDDEFSEHFDDHAFTSMGTRADADQNVRNLCDTARTTGIIIFSISFEAPSAGQDLMRYCASSEGRYYHVQGQEISAAFDAIAESINGLRLVQ